MFGSLPNNKVARCLDEAEKASEPIAVFCSTGQARTGMVLAFHLHRRYALTVAGAVSEVIEHALAGGATRKPTVEQVVVDGVPVVIGRNLCKLRGC